MVVQLEACLHPVAGTQNRLMQVDGMVAKAALVQTPPGTLSSSGVCMMCACKMLPQQSCIACRGGPYQHWHPVLCGLACLCAPAPMHSCRQGQTAGAQHQISGVAACHVSGSTLAALGKACKAAGPGCRALFHCRLNKCLPGIPAEAAGADPLNTYLLEWRCKDSQGVMD